MQSNIFHRDDRPARAYGVYARRKRRGANPTLFRRQAIAWSLEEADAKAQELMTQADQENTPIEITIQGAQERITLPAKLRA